MSIKQFKKLFCITVAGVAAFALCLTAAGESKKQVTKDLGIRGYVHSVITDVSSLPVISFRITDASGVATHGGLFTLEAEGWLNLATGEGFDTGVFIAANGDEIYWDGYIYVDPVTLTPKLRVEVKSDNPGTGRFANCSGGFVADMFNLALDLEGGTVEFDYIGAGEITY